MFLIFYISSKDKELLLLLLVSPAVYFKARPAVCLLAFSHWNEDMCSDLSIVFSSGDSWWWEKKNKDAQSKPKKKQYKRWGGWDILADLHQTTDAQVSGFRGCVSVCAWVSTCVLFPAQLCSPTASTVFPLTSCLSWCPALNCSRILMSFYKDQPWINMPVSN